MSAAVIDKLRLWIELVHPDLAAPISKVIHGNPHLADAPRPTGVYANYWSLSDSSIGNPWENTTDTAGATIIGPPDIETVVHERGWPRRGVLRVEFRGTGALERAQKLELSTGREDVRALLIKDLAVNIVVRPLGSVVDLSELLSTINVKGAQIDFSYRHWLQIDQDTPYIETAEVDLTA